MQSIFTGEFGFPRPAGLTYIRDRRLFFVAQSRAARTQLLRLTPFDTSKGVVSLPKLARPSTLAFDPARKRVIAISAKVLTTVQSPSLAAGTSPVSRVDIGYLDLREPQAATFDRSNRSLLVLDKATKEIVRVRASSAGSTPVRISLAELGAQTLQGLAYNPVDRLLYVTSPDRELLYGLSRTGKVQRIFSLRNAAIENLEGMVFAPSTDPTDSPSVEHLFVADSGGPNALGRVIELSLARPISLPSTVTVRLTRTIRTSKLTPPIPDPSGITYLAATDQLLIADSEVDELPIYQGANLFLVSREGAVVGTGTTLGFSHEPTGVAFNPTDSALYFSDDDKRVVFVDRPGPDRRHGTADDSVARVDTSSFGSRDPEDVAVDPESGHVFVADGVGAEVYEIDPVNGALGDEDDFVTHFDLATYGVRNVEGLGYDPVRRTLLVVADRERRILELTRSGGLVRIINVATIPGVRWLSGVTVAPTSDPSDDSSSMSYWITDRQVDNDQNPSENDGILYEVVLP